MNGFRTKSVVSLEPAEGDDEITLLLSPFSNNVENFRAGFECTSYPCDLIWGPGSWTDAIAALSSIPVHEDEIEYTDRVFAIRRGAEFKAEVGPFSYPIDGLESARSPKSLSQIPPTDRNGDWYLIGADFPEDAVRHVAETHVTGRNLTSLHGVRRPPRCECGVDELAKEASWDDVLRLSLPKVKY